jgi:DNA-binding response OmpR family regulator
VLLDVMMPHVSGLDVLASIRGNERWQHLPVIVLTAANDQSTKHRANELGVSDFLGKPVDPHELVPRIRNVLIVKRHYGSPALADVFDAPAAGGRTSPPSRSTSASS